MTIEERASNYEHDVEASKRKGNDVNANGNGNYDSIDVFEAYKDGATEQKEIDIENGKKFCKKWMDEIIKIWLPDIKNNESSYNRVINDIYCKFTKAMEEHI